ncbi:MAG: methyltransferase domain-containing protein [bacterium]
MYYKGSHRDELYPQGEGFFAGRLDYTLSLTDWKNKSVLLAGDSYGQLAQRILQLGASYVYSFDIAPPSKEIDYLKKRYHNKFDHEILSIFDLSCKNTFDVVGYFEVIEHLPPGTELSSLKLLFSSLKEGGEILLSTPHSSLLSYITDPAVFVGHRHYNLNQIKDLLIRSGFTDISLTRGGFVYSGLDILCMYFFKWVLRKKYVSSFTSRLNSEYPHSHGLDLFAYGKKK